MTTPGAAPPPSVPTAATAPGGETTGAVGPDLLTTRGPIAAPGPPIAPAPVAAPGRRPQAVRGVGIAACVLIGIAAATHAGTAVSVGWSRFELLTGFDDALGDASGFDSILSAIQISMIGGLASALTSAVAGMVFLSWFDRARRNAELIAPGAFRLGPEWAVGGWFVPLGNLALPAIVMSDLCRASGFGPRESGLVPGWWSTLVGSWAAGLAALLVLATGALDGAGTVSWIGALLNLVEATLTLASAALAAVIVTRVSARQDPPRT